jgi:hypothetical protein
MNTTNSYRRSELSFRPVKGIENYWIIGKPGIAGCIGVRYSNYWERWTYQNLTDTPEKAASDLRSREQPRVSFGEYAASPNCLGARDVFNELYPE